MHERNFNDFNILLLEDNLMDIALLKWAFQRCDFTPNLEVVRNGLEAMDFVRNKGSYESAFRPDLFLLDLNVPRKTGFEVLKEIKEDDMLRQIPILVLTSSSRILDINKCYELSADGFFVKPNEFAKLIEFAGFIKSMVDKIKNPHRWDRKMDFRQLFQDISEPKPLSSDNLAWMSI
jgi:chemotaxis family two-component system response regulator Rcp1